MKPYYDEAGITIYHGDCRDVLAWLEADVLVTDPPYGIDYASRYAHLNRAVLNDHSLQVRDAALHLWGDRPALVFGTWRESRPEGTVARLIWDKGLEAGLGGVGPWMPRDEEIYVLGKGWGGVRRSNIYRYNAIPNSSALRDALNHATPKPPELLRALLESCPLGVVADPFMGSGATLIAAKGLARKAIGIEIDEAHCEMTARRLGQGVLL